MVPGTGAINAAAPARGRHQVRFRVDYARGWGKDDKLYWKTFNGTCGRYDGGDRQCRAGAFTP